MQEVDLSGVYATRIRIAWLSPDVQVTFCIIGIYICIYYVQYLHPVISYTYRQLLEHMFVMCRKITIWDIKNTHVLK